jgi:hypothetical protein
LAGRLDEPFADAYSDRHTHGNANPDANANTYANSNSDVNYETGAGTLAHPGR